MLYRTMSEGRPATRIRSALPIATFVSVCGIGRTIFGDSKPLSAIIGMLSAIDRNHCPQSIGTPVRNRRNPHQIGGASHQHGEYRSST
jgi:hypothetical protein